jgi:hypothetical protein
VGCETGERVGAISEDTPHFGNALTPFDSAVRRLGVLLCEILLMPHEDLRVYKVKLEVRQLCTAFVCSSKFEALSVATATILRPAIWGCTYVVWPHEVRPNGVARQRLLFRSRSRS